MPRPELVEYVKSQLAAGVPQTDIAKAAEVAGWGIVDIAAAFEALKAPPQAPPIVPQPPTVVTNTPAAPQVSPAIVQPNIQPATQPVVVPVTEGKKSFGGKLSQYIVFAVVLLAFSGATGYAYFQKVWFFSSAPYTESDILSGFIVSLGSIKSSTYKAEATFSVNPRDEGALPFALDEEERKDLEERHARDVTRVRNVQSILSALRAVAPRYPETLDSALRARKLSTDIQIDPLTKKPYEYRRAADGSDFELYVTFETETPVAYLRKYASYDLERKVEIQGKTAVLTSKGSPYISISSKPPKPYFMRLGEMLQMLPVNASGQASVTAAADWSKADKTEWKLNAAASADLGDLIFKIDADTLYKDATYYLRLNNFPGIFGASLSDLKGKWISIQASSTTQSRSYSSVSSLARDVPKLEEMYKKQRESASSFFKSFVKIAEEERLIVFKSQPVAERKDGALLYRYELALRREAIAPFYEKMSKVAEREEFRKGDNPFVAYFNDASMLEYLRSSAFEKTLNYYEANTAITLWVDAKGIPARMEYSVRVIPPDEVTQLKDKQVNLVFALDISNVNEPIVVEVPEQVTTLEELSDLTAKGPKPSVSTQEGWSSRDARRINDIRQLQVALELYYDETGTYAYGLSALAKKYIATVPTDPLGGEYQYSPLTSSGTLCTPQSEMRCPSYVLRAVLENDKNTSLQNDVDGTFGAIACSDTVRAYCVRP